jgi:uncharacterized protein (TIGR02996 family)
VLLFPEPDPFVRAILEKPDDDLPRLVYADWLDEHGDAARAEFIRVQIELARLPKDDPRRPALQARSDELQEAHAARWVGRGYDRAVSWRFRRGFVHGVVVDLTVLADLAYLILQHQTIRTLRTIHDGRRPQFGRDTPMQRLAQRPHLTLLTHVSLAGNRLGDVEVCEFVEAPHLTNLRVLDLRGNRLTDVTMIALQHADNLAGLRRLDLRFNDVGARGVGALATSEPLRGLKRLRMRAADLGDDGLAALRAAPWLMRVTRIDPVF